MIEIVPLGAGQDVGRSCILVTIGGKNIMLDCGMHMGYQDERLFPDFSYLSNSHEFDSVLDCLLITHLYVLELDKQGILFLLYLAIWIIVGRCLILLKCVVTLGLSLCLIRRKLFAQYCWKIIGRLLLKKQEKLIFSLLKWLKLA